MLEVVRSTLVLALVVVTLGLAAPAEATTLRVITVEVEASKLDSYVAAVKKIRGHMTRLELPGTMRIWQATSAGSSTGALVVAVEYPTLASWADATVKTNADPEIQKLIANLPGIRKILSDSLYEELGN